MESDEHQGAPLTLVFVILMTKRLAAKAGLFYFCKLHN